MSVFAKEMRGFVTTVFKEVNGHSEVSGNDSPFSSLSIWSRKERKKEAISLCFKST